MLQQTNLFRLVMRFTDKRIHFTVVLLSPLYALRNVSFHNDILTPIVPKFYINLQVILNE